MALEGNKKQMALGYQKTAEKKKLQIHNVTKINNEMHWKATCQSKQKENRPNTLKTYTTIFQ